MDKINDVTRMEPDKAYGRTFSYDDENDTVWLTQGTQLGTGDNAQSYHFRYGMDMKNIELDELKVEAAKNIHITRMRPRCFKKCLDAKAISELPLVLDPIDYPATGGAGITTKERNTRYMVDTMGMDREQAEYYAENPDELKKAMSVVKLRKANK